MAGRGMTASAIAAALALATAMSAAMAFAAGCKSPDDLMGAAQKDVKKSLDMFLVVKNKSPADNSTDISPDTTLYIDFDRALKTDTVTSSNIKLYPSSKAGASGAELTWTWTYDQALNRLYVTPRLLDGGVSYLVSLGTGLLSAEDESLDEEYSWDFSTGLIPHGNILINSGATYATSKTVTLSIEANNLVDKYYYSLNESDVTNASHAWWGLSGSTITASNFLAAGDNTYTLYYQFISAAGAVSKIFHTSIILDTTPPNAPAMLSGPTSPWTASHNPSWSWTTGGNGGNGVFNYYISSAGWSGETTSTSCAPALADGSYSFCVRERDAAGNWSENSTTYTDVIVNAPPNAPVVTRPASVTLDSTPTWSWSSGGFGSGVYRWQLDSTSGFWTTTTEQSYTPGAALDDGVHHLYVEERDIVEWSSYGSASIRTTAVLPYNGSRASRTPVLSWRELRGATYAIQKKVFAFWSDYKTGLREASYEVPKRDPLSLGEFTWRVKVIASGIPVYYLPSEDGSVMNVVE